MRRPKKTSNSSRQRFLDTVRLIKQLKTDHTQELQGVIHDYCPDPAPTGRASTNLSGCSDDCPACAIDRKYLLLEQQIGRDQRAAQMEAGRLGIAQADSQSRAASARRKITLDLYRKLEPAAESQKDMAGKLAKALDGRISQPTLRKFQTENALPTIRRKNKS